MKSTPIKLPEYIQFKNLKVIKIYVKVGDKLRRGDLLMEVAAPNVLIEVPCPYDGLIASIKRKIGDRIPPGSELGITINSGYSLNFYLEQRITDFRFTKPRTNLLIPEKSARFCKAWSVMIDSQSRENHETSLQEQANFSHNKS